MLIRGKDLGAFGFHGLSIRDFGAVTGGAASVAVVEVPANGEHPAAYSSASDKLYFVLGGRLRMDVDGVAYTAEAGDLVVVPRGQVFDYFDCWGKPSRLLLVHIPPFDAEAEHILPSLLREHDVHLTGERVVLRPMTEDDWECLVAWNSDPEVLIWSDGTEEVRPPEEIKGIYRGASLFAYTFIVEYGGEPIGECWLQKMNKPHLIERFPGRDLRRIDLMIGRKDLWGQGLGTDAIRTLVRFGFGVERADGIVGQVGRHNPRSRRAFEKAGFTELSGYESAEDWALAVWREEQ